MSAWYETRAFHALAHDFRLVLEEPELGRHFEQLFDGFPVPERDDVVVYRVTTSPTGYEITTDGEQPIVAPRVSPLAGLLMQRINYEAVSPGYALTVHAGAVQRGGAGVVLPAHMESGKSTLTAGLVRAGFGYLTDEAAAFDWDTGVLEPFAKPLTLDPGSWPLFPELEPAAPADDAASASSWLVPPSTIRPDAIGGPCRVQYVVFPRYESGIETELVAMSRAEALVELAKNTFLFNRHARHALDTLAGVARQADCYRLPMGNLDRACELVEELTSG